MNLLWFLALFSQAGVLLLSLSTIASVVSPHVGRDTDSDGTSTHMHCGYPLGTLQIVHPAPGAWVPMIDRGKGEARAPLLHCEMHICQIISFYDPNL